MPFLPALTGWARKQPGPRATIHVGINGYMSDRRRVTFALTRELIELACWQAGERFVISIGVGEDKGAFQITRSDRPNTGLKLIANSRALGFRISLNLPPVIHGIDVCRFFDGLPRPCPCDHAVNDGVLVLKARRDEAASAAETTVIPMRAAV